MTATLQLAINAAVGEFSERIQSLAMPRAATLAGIIRMHVEPLLTEAQEGLALSGARLADETKRAQDNFAQALEHRSAHERILSTLHVAEEMRQRLIAERDHWKANHDNAVEIKRAILGRPDLGDRAERVVDLVEERARLQSTLGFFASVIKSGEPWSETCQKAYDEAMGKPATVVEFPLPRNATALEPAASKLTP